MGDAGEPEEGIIFFEGQLRENLPLCSNNVWISRFTASLQAVLSNPNHVFEVGQDLLDGQDQINTRLVLGSDFEKAQTFLCSLKIVEYQGSQEATTTPLICHPTRNIVVDVKLYRLYTRLPDVSEDIIPQGQMTLMPNLTFEETWSRLVFDSDIKEDLIWMMQNLIKHQSSATDLNRIVLLHGPPGTGKTSLCQGLAQKISIRLSSTYDGTVLLQISTSTLMSKYYSESARKVDEIFQAIASECDALPNNFFCVMIDEVESIAASREFSISHGESQDSLRATNALLTGLDRLQKYKNVIFLCTSNLLDALDVAFVDRCGLKFRLDPPSEKAQYEILRQRMQTMIDNKVIASDLHLPTYDDAALESYSNPNGGGSQLRNIVKCIRSENDRCEPSQHITGRTLIQLPMQAVMRYNRSSMCSLDMAFKHIVRLIKQSRPAQSRKPSLPTAESEEGPNYQLATRPRPLGEKRKYFEVEGLGTEIQEPILQMAALASAEGKRFKVSMTIESSD